MTEISADSVVSRSREIVAGEIDDEIVMMSVENGTYYALDPVGSSIWELIETPIKVSELVDRLLLGYDVERETCERDVMTFLEKLHENGILELQG
ncbi:MAG: Coenzyme PQQ synthesis protein D [Syntrophorhabdus sp. PtaU1.Bin058]|nr:MAG: Coenzyme PQQ synthesis protein D [Syntrophorhabdus sp. PtaU1.Bin058]